MHTLSQWDRLLHDIKGKSANLVNAVGLLRDCPISERREIIGLMTAAAQDVLKAVSELEKEAA